MQLDVVCSPEELAYTSDQPKSSQQYYARKLSSYCDGYVPTKNLARPMSLSEFDQTFLDLSRAQTKEQFSRDLSDISDSKTDDFLVRWLNAAHTPEEIYAVGDYITEYYRSTSHVLWRPNAGDLEVSDVVITNLQQVALELYSCQRFGGCGPNSLKVMRTCTFVAGCEPGWSYEQYLFMNHSPIEMEYIQRVIRRIFSG